MQDFEQKTKDCLQEIRFLGKRLEFAQLSERKFGGLGVPVQRGNRNTGRGFNFCGRSPKIAYNNRSSNAR